jgi:hypothetical protein
VLREDIAEAYRRYADMLRIAAPSDRLHAFTLAARRIAALIHPIDFPRAEAGDRLWDTAQAYGLVAAHGVDAVQKHLSAALDGPIIPTENDPVRLDIEPDEQERAQGRRQRQRRTDRSRRKSISRDIGGTNAQPNRSSRPDAEGSEGDNDLDLQLAWLPQTDLGNVERFVSRYGSKLKWCSTKGWILYDGKRWSNRGADSYVLRAEHATVRAIQNEAKAISKLAAREKDKERRRRAISTFRFGPRLGTKVRDCAQNVARKTRAG